jgi:hypothetical protein
LWKRAWAFYPFKPPGVRLHRLEASWSGVGVGVGVVVLECGLHDRERQPSNC